MTSLPKLVVGAGLLLIASPCVAQSDDAPVDSDNGFNVSANIGVVSDYRYRGISLSDRKPAIQGGLDVEAGDFFVGAWGSTIADYAGADVEVDVYGGLQGGSEALSWTAGFYAYLYPGGADVSYIEVIASAETYVGPLTLGIEGSFAPKQNNLDVSNSFLGLSAAFETELGLGLFAKVGLEDGFYRNKVDWELGFQHSQGALSASLSYVDSSYGSAQEEGRLGEGAVLASITLTL